MYLYLAGPMRGILLKNFPAFDRYASKLRQCGFRVLSPAESPPPNAGPNPTRDDCLRHDLLIVGVVDGVAALPGWQDSPGARLEVAAAWAFNIPVYEADGLVDLDVTGVSDLKVKLSQFELPQTSVVIPRERQYYNDVPLIGLSGFAGAGKDEVAKVLVERHGFTRVAFADPLKDVARALGWNGEKDDAGRKLLQDLGVGVREYLNSEAWVLAGEERIEDCDTQVVVTDVRFKNEVFMIKRRGGVLVRVERPNTGAVNAHVSEHQVTAQDCDHVLFNDGTLDDLPAKVEALLDQLGHITSSSYVPTYAAA